MHFKAIGRDESLETSAHNLSAVESAAEQKPVGQAIAIALSVFVGVTSIFAAIMAFGVAPLQMREVGISGNPKAADEAARWFTYGVGLVFILNSLLAFRSGRKSFRASMFCTALFIAANIALAVLYLKTW